MNPFIFHNPIFKVMIAFVGLILCELSRNIRENYAYRSKPVGLTRTYLVFVIKVNFLHMLLLHKISNFLSMVRFKRIENWYLRVMIQKIIRIIVFSMILEPNLALKISSGLDDINDKILLPFLE